MRSSFPDERYKNWSGAIDKTGSPDGWVRDDGMELCRFQTTVRVKFASGEVRKYSIHPFAGEWQSPFKWMDWLNEEYPQANHRE